MENFEGSRGNPERKDKKLNWRSKLRLTAAAIGLIAVGTKTDVTPKIVPPDEIRSGEPPEPKGSVTQPQPKNL